ncbi:MAG: SDR family NAD(P)-dependent oxidoreductase [Planctomycetaceae bacterium]
MSASKSTSNSFASLEGHKSLVTGSSSGIGREIALELARAGSDLILHCGRSINQAEDVADEIRQLGRQATVLCQDLCDSSRLEAFAQEVWQEQEDFR